MDLAYNSDEAMSVTLDLRPLPYVCGVMALGTAIVSAALHHAQPVDYAYVVPGVAVGFTTVAISTYLMRHWLAPLGHWWRKIGALLLVLTLAMLFHIGYVEVADMYEHKGRELGGNTIILGMFPMIMHAWKLYGSKSGAPAND
jgi:hypothetical protein